MRNALRPALAAAALPWLLALATPALRAAPGPAGAAGVAMPVSFEAVLALEARAPDYRAAYGAAPSQFSSLWLPPGDAPAPVLVLVHGGCWLVDYDAGHIAPLAARLAADGFAVWVPEYRRVGEAGGGWPGTAQDLLASLAQLAALDEARLDRGNLLLAGHSAGGQLALWLAARGAAQWPPSLVPRAVVGLAPIADLAAYARGGNSCEAVTSRFLGGMPETVPQVYAAASPAALRSRLATLLLRGSDDPIVGAGQPASMAGRLLVTQRELAGAGHFDWIHPGTAAYADLLPALRRLAGWFDAPGKP